MELGQTVQLFVYGGGALHLASGKEKEGASPWPRRAILAALAGYGGFLALSWAGFGFSLASELLDRPVPVPEGVGTSSLIVTVLLAWTLGLCALWGKDYADQRKAAGPKYGGRPLPERESAELLARLGEPYYLLSRAVNEGGGMTVSDLVNEYRVERAKRLLLERPGDGVLDVALESGFQAKSTFNDVFRKATGMSPSEYRANGMQTEKK